MTHNTLVQVAWDQVWMAEAHGDRLRQTEKYREVNYMAIEQ